MLKIKDYIFMKEEVSYMYQYKIDTIKLIFKDGGFIYIEATIDDVIDLDKRLSNKKVESEE